MVCPFTLLHRRIAVLHASARLTSKRPKQVMLRAGRTSRFPISPGEDLPWFSQTSAFAVGSENNGNSLLSLSVFDTCVTGEDAGGGYSTMPDNSFLSDAICSCCS